MSDLLLDTALLPSGWAHDVRLSVTRDGVINRVEIDAPGRGAERVPGVTVPGLSNLHSHAFQRALAGLTERGSGRGDNFWSWRSRMYGFLADLSPDDVRAIAGQLYAELLRHGFTSVGEFHYLRNAPDGRPYDDPVEMGRAILAAAEDAGIGLTLMPTLYRRGGFGGAPLSDGQRRFGASVEEIVGDIAVLGAAAERRGDRAGLALHSLRAATPEDLVVAVEAARGIHPTLPVHIHLAEQEREVEECVAWSGARPVEWLLDHGPVDASWCLVHATHVTDAEVEGIARSGAVVGLCPTTEANLGDGVFPLPKLLEAGGGFGVGTDSHVGVSPVGELRTLEYGQRLTSGRRNVAAGDQPRSTGRVLFDGAAADGARAIGSGSGSITVGQRADLVVLDESHPALVGRDGDDVIDSWLFSGDESPVRDVMARGTWRVRDGRHVAADEIRSAFAETTRALQSRTGQLGLELDD